jgi:flavodoxin
MLKKVRFYFFTRVKGTKMNRNMLLRVLVLLSGCLLFNGCTSHNAVMTFNREATVSQTSVAPDHFNAIVVYDSWSGNTRQIAEEIADVLNCPAMGVDDAGECVMSDYDLVVVGSPVHGGMPTGKIDDFLSQLKPAGASAVFVTYGAPLFGTLTANQCLNSMEKKLGGHCLGRYKCNGFHKIFRTYPSHPDAVDKSEAARFAAGLMERLGPYERMVETAAETIE